VLYITHRDTPYEYLIKVHRADGSWDEYTYTPAGQDEDRIFLDSSTLKAVRIL